MVISAIPFCGMSDQGEFIMNKIIKAALEFGFTVAVEIAAEDICPSENIRALCAPDKCSSYGTNWVCPPGCGSFEKCRDIVDEYDKGVLLQIKYEDVDTSDLKVCESLSKDFGERIIQLRDTLLGEFPMLMTLATGGCRECEQCTYPNAECRKPHIRRGKRHQHWKFTKQCIS